MQINNPNNCIIEEFYRYPTSVVHRIVEYDEGFRKGYSSYRDEDIKELFDALLNVLFLRNDSIYTIKIFFACQISIDAFLKYLGHIALEIF
jgi:hypothetical protein